MALGHSTTILRASKRPIVLMFGKPTFRSEIAAFVVPERKDWRTKAMRNVFKSVFLVCLLTLSASLSAQTPTTSTTSFPRFNPPPCDFNDNFYTVNGFDVTSLDQQAAGRFGNFRQTGAPAFKSGQVNWVTDSNCSVNDPIRRNVRILATTGAYKDDTGAPTEFLSIIAFLLNQNFFTGGASAVPNVRGFTTQQIVGNFEAYVAPKQTVNGVLAPTPCGTMGDGLTPCFPVTSVATPRLRHDWRISSNRTALDGSAPLAYFGDDLTGSWIVTYFWWTKFAVGGRPDQPKPTATCQTILAAAGKQNGFSLDGTPILHTGDELHFIEGVPGTPPQFGFTQAQTTQLLQAEATAPCGAEGALDVGGADGGAVWLVCPTILDPRNGAIAPDAFLDIVRKPGDGKLDPRFGDNFACLQQTGQFPDPKMGCMGNTAATAVTVP